MDAVRLNRLLRFVVDSTALDLGVVPDRVLAGPDRVCVIDSFTTVGPEVCSDNTTAGRSLAGSCLPIAQEAWVFPDLGPGHGHTHA